MEQSTLTLSNVITEEQKDILKNKLMSMIVVISVEIDKNTNNIYIQYETPTNLNSIEKEIYDAGFRLDVKI